jgi:cytosolic phospholipase A2
MNIEKASGKAVVDASRDKAFQQQEKDVDSKAKWLWYEFTPFEVGCDELGGEMFLRPFHVRLIPHVAWIPVWGLGRQFANGKSLDRRVR